MAIFLLWHNKAIKHRLVEVQTETFSSPRPSESLSQRSGARAREMPRPRRLRDSEGRGDENKTGSA